MTMTCTLKKKVGNNEYQFSFAFNNHAEFFQQAALFEILPETGPNGEVDLRLNHRVSKEGYHFYSVVCDSIGKEFKFGQLKQPEGFFYIANGVGEWTDLYRHNGSEQQQMPNPAAQQPQIQQQAQTPMAQQPQMPSVGNQTDVLSQFGAVPQPMS